MLARDRARLAVNLANGSTLAGLAVAVAGRARLARGPSGLLIATCYRLPVPAVPAFTLGSVILTREETLPSDSTLFRHEARHTTQYAWCGGLLMLPMYFAAAGISWMLCGDFGAWNVYERRAGLADGGYLARPLRWPTGVQRVPTRAGHGPGTQAPGALVPGTRELSGTARRAGDPEGEIPGGSPAGRAGSTATPSP